MYSPTEDITYPPLNLFPFTIWPTPGFQDGVGLTAEFASAVVLMPSVLISDSVALEADLPGFSIYPVPILTLYCWSVHVTLPSGSL